MLKIYLITIAISIALMILTCARVYVIMKHYKWKKRTTIPEKIRSFTIAIILIAIPFVNVIWTFLIGVVASEEDIERSIAKLNRRESEDGNDTLSNYY